MHCSRWSWGHRWTLPVGLCCFDIQYLYLFSPWCNIQNKPSTNHLQWLTERCMWSTQLTSISINTAVKGQCFLSHWWVFSSSSLLLCTRCLFSQDFSTLFCTKSVKSRSRSMWPFNKKTVKIAFFSVHMVKLSLDLHNMICGTDLLFLL